MRYRSEIVVTVVALLCVAAIVLHLSQRSSTTPPPHSNRLAVMTYNIHQGFDNSGKVDPRVFLRSIQKANPDIVGLQESESNRPALANYDLVRWLATNLDMYSYYGPATKEQTYGVALLSKYPLKDVTTIPLPSIEDPRVLIGATIAFQGKDVRIFVTHLGLSVEDRYEQLRWILEEQIKKATLPTVFMGDLNTTGDEDFTLDGTPAILNDDWYPNRLKGVRERLAENQDKGIYRRARNAHFQGLATYRAILTDAWQTIHPNSPSAYSWFDTNEALGRPYDKLLPPELIDHIFVSKDFQVLDAKIIKDRDTIVASDHLPVMATIELPRAP